MDELLKVLEQDSHAEPSCSSRHFYSSSGTAFGEDRHFLFGLPIREQFVDVPYIQLLLLCLIFPLTLVHQVMVMEVTGYFFIEAAQLRLVCSPFQYGLCSRCSSFLFIHLQNLDSPVPNLKFDKTVIWL